jgi:ppGpp synthetase/RelA/SpoT-type nucleotidyltranferase
MPLSEEIIAEAKQRLARESDRYSKLARFVETECWKLVRGNGISAAVHSRVKRSDSLEGKLKRWMAAGDSGKIEAVTEVDDVFRLVGDIAAVRVATYVEGDRERVVRMIEGRFGNVQTERHAKASGYRATHCQVSLPADYLNLEEAANVRDLSCEVQVCSMLAHVWNEIEHDMRYKLTGVDNVDQFEVSRLQALLDVTKDGDTYIEQLLQERSLRIAKGMVDDIARRFPSSPDFYLHASYVIREAVRLGYSTTERIEKGLLVGDYEARGSSLIFALNDALVANGEEAFILNASTSDVFLVLLLHAHHTDLCGLHFRDLETPDPGRIPILAAFVDEHPFLTT